MKKLSPLFLNIFSGILFFVLIGVVFFPDFSIGRNFERNQVPYSIIMTDRFGEEVYRSFNQENREWIDVSEIPDDFKMITVLAEDKRFFSHLGIDGIGIARAIFQNLIHKKIKQGASTITQQLARKSFLSDERSIIRKLREMFIALGIESKQTKEEILEMYLNVVPYGPTLSGIKGGAETYFGAKPKNLSIAQMLVLAMIPKNPVELPKDRYIHDWLGKCSEKRIKCSPLFSEGYKLSRIETLLLDFGKKKKLSEQKIYSIWEELQTMVLPERKNRVENDFLHWQFFVRNFLVRHGVELSDYPGGLKIQTSIDKNLQKEVLAQFREKYQKKLSTEFLIENVAAMALDNDERHPLIWIGSVDWNQGRGGKIDMLRAYRQIGSAIKPFIYSLVLENGFDPSTIFWDTRVQFPGSSKVIQNWDGRYLGAIELQKALAMSRNVPAAQAVYLAGGEKKVKKFLGNVFGFETKKYANHAFGWTIGLGTIPLKLMNVVNAYATMATGKKQDICPILSLYTLLGEKIKNPCEKKTEKVLSKETKFFLWNILSNQSLRPKGSWRKNLTISETPFAAKSGTSTKRISLGIYPVDNVVVGFNPDITVFVWGGDIEGLPLQYGSYGTQTVAPFFKDITKTILKKFSGKNSELSIPNSVEWKQFYWGRKGVPNPKYRIPGMSFVSKTENKKRIPVDNKKVSEILNGKLED